MNLYGVGEGDGRGGGGDGGGGGEGGGNGGGDGEWGGGGNGGELLGSGGGDGEGRGSGGGNLHPILLHVFFDFDFFHNQIDYDNQINILFFYVIILKWWIQRIFSYCSSNLFYLYCVQVIYSHKHFKRLQLLKMT